MKPQGKFAILEKKGVDAFPGSYATLILEANTYDPLLSSRSMELGKWGLPGLGMRDATQPTHETDNIDSSRYRHLLQMRALLPNVARAT